MQLADSLARDASQIFHRVKTVVACTHIHVIDIEEDIVARAPAHFIKETQLRHLDRREADVARRVFEHERAFEHFLGVLNIRAHSAQGLVRIGQGQQIMRIEPVNAGPAEMIRDPERIESIREGLQP
jgi:hypothetical protein